MAREVITAPDGRQEAKFTRKDEQVDFQHGLFRRIQRPQGLTDRQIAGELSDFADQLDRDLSAVVGAIGQIEETTAELRPEPRAAKIAEALREPIARLQKTAATRMSELQKAISAAESRIMTSVQRPQTGDGIAGLRLDLALQEARSELRAMPEGSRVAAVKRAASDGDLLPLWALSGSPVKPLVKSTEELQDVQKRIAIEREPWRQALLQFREAVHRSGLEMVAGAHQFASASVRRIEANLGVPVATVAPMRAFLGETELPGLTITAPLEARSAA